jgi:hypothetical protein
MRGVEDRDDTKHYSLRCVLGVSRFTFYGVIRSHTVSMLKLFCSHNIVVNEYSTLNCFSKDDVVDILFF